MKRLIQPTISLMLVLTIFISTGGFMVYVHHCQHHGQSFTSIFMPADHHAALSCHTDKHYCEDGTISSLHHCDGKCCHDTELYLKITPDTEPAKKIQHKIILPTERFTYVACDIQDKLSYKHKSDKAWKDPPPEVNPPGRVKLLFYHQLKLGTF